MKTNLEHSRFKPVKTQFLNSDNKIVDFDVCASCTLEEAKNYYIPKGYEYIDSSTTAFYDNEKSQYLKLYHFFKKIKHNVK